MSQRKDAVIRISAENHSRIKELISKIKDDEGGRITLNSLTKRMLDTIESVLSGDVVYLVDGKYFRDISEARGEAIVSSVKHKSPTVWPSVAVIIGTDKGA